MAISWKIIHQSEVQGYGSTSYEEISVAEIPKGVLLKTLNWQTKEGDTRGYCVNSVFLPGLKLKDFD